MSIIFIVHFDEFYTGLFSHNTCILSFYIYKKTNKKKKNMANKSAESYVSLKGNDKAISILQYVIIKAQTNNQQTKNSPKK